MLETDWQLGVVAVGKDVPGSVALLLVTGSVGLAVPLVAGAVVVALVVALVAVVIVVVVVLVSVGVEELFVEVTVLVLERLVEFWEEVRSRAKFTLVAGPLQHTVTSCTTFL